jgi:hypothetical protein
MELDQPIAKAEHLRRLKNTNKPTIVVEGKDDLLLLHSILKHLGYDEGEVFPVGSCAMLKILYKEITQARQANPNAYPMVKLFFADKDMYVFTGIPADEAGIFFTTGYSIENDLFADIENYIDNLLVFGYTKYKSHKQKILDSVISWFAFEVEDYLNHIAEGKQKDTQFSKLNLKNTSYFCDQTLAFTTLFLNQRGFTQVSQNSNILQRLRQNYALDLRGHTLFEVHNLLSSVLRRKHKDNKTDPDISYNEAQLFNQSFAQTITYKTPYISRICVELSKAMAQ